MKIPVIGQGDVNTRWFGNLHKVYLPKKSIAHRGMLASYKLQKLSPCPPSLQT